VKRNGNVLTGHCNCLAGLAGVCSHVGAILFAVEAGVRMLKSKTCTLPVAYALRYRQCVITGNRFYLFQHKEEKAR